MKSSEDRRRMRPRRLTGALVMSLMLGGWMLPACSAQGGETQPPSDEVVVTINGQPVSRDEVEETVRDQLAQMETEYKRKKHALMETAVRNYVQSRLLEQETAARGVSQEELLNSEEAAKVQVTDEEVDAWYEANRARLGSRPKDQVAPQIKQFLQQQKQAQVRQEFIASLEAKSKVVYLLEPLRFEVASDGFPAQGPEDAPVTIVEFSDFECPYCARLLPTLQQVEEAYGEKVRLVYRQFPLNRIHPNAQKAAEAALCAYEQGQFWEMHDLMFQEQKKLQVAELKEKAVRLGLDTEAFNQCLDSGRVVQQVEVDLEAGVTAGVSGTPAMFINGRFLNGAVPYENLASIIDEELARHGESVE
jgi:protein-disulfide isomerase